MLPRKTLLIYWYYAVGFFNAKTKFRDLLTGLLFLSVAVLTLLLIGMSASLMWSFVGGRKPNFQITIEEAHASLTEDTKVETVPFALSYTKNTNINIFKISAEKLFYKIATSITTNQLQFSSIKLSKCRRRRQKRF